jgi:hypothetical protein
MNAQILQEKIHGQEFKIAFSETNLRYLASEHDSEGKRKALETNLAGIRDAQAEIARLRKEAGK